MGSPDESRNLEPHFPSGDAVFTVDVTASPLAFGFQHEWALGSSPRLGCLAENYKPRVGLPEVSSDSVDGIELRVEGVEGGTAPVGL